MKYEKKIFEFKQVDRIGQFVISLNALVLLNLVGFFAFEIFSDSKSVLAVCILLLFLFILGYKGNIFSGFLVFSNFNSAITIDPENFSVSDINVKLVDVKRIKIMPGPFLGISVSVRQEGKFINQKSITFNFRNSSHNIKTLESLLTTLSNTPLKVDFGIRNYIGAVIYCLLIIGLYFFTEQDFPIHILIVFCIWPIMSVSKLIFLLTRDRWLLSYKTR